MRFWAAAELRRVLLGLVVLLRFRGKLLNLLGCEDFSVLPIDGLLCCGFRLIEQKRCGEVAASTYAHRVSSEAVAYPIDTR